MRKFFLIVCALFISIPLFAQLEVKDNSFRKLRGFVNENPDIQTDDNEQPYAVLIIKTENIDSKQRRELDFQGDARTFFETEYKEGEIWLYLSYYATYIKISHEDLSSTEFEFPTDMQPKCGYEMTLVNTMVSKNKTTGIIDVVSSPSGATILIDGKNYGLTPKIISNLPLGNHVLSLSKKGCETETRNITLDAENKLDINEILFDGREVAITTDSIGDAVYVDGLSYGSSPITIKMCVGEHNIKVVRGGKYRKKKVTVAKNGGDSIADFSFVLKNRTFTVNGVSFEMVAIQGGTFTMGTNKKFPEDRMDDVQKALNEAQRPAHQVTINDFGIAKFEVTQKLWIAVMGYNPVSDDCVGDQVPVYNMSWNEVQEFISKLNELTGYHFRLPTEAEWEYAARGKGEFQTQKLDDVAWYFETAMNVFINGKTGRKHPYEGKYYGPHPVGTKQPNAYDLYDMFGNVSEWCQDRWGSYSYASETDPT